MGDHTPPQTPTPPTLSAAPKQGSSRTAPESFAPPSIQTQSESRISQTTRPPDAPSTFSPQLFVPDSQSPEIPISNRQIPGKEAYRHHSTPPLCKFPITKTTTPLSRRHGIRIPSTPTPAPRHRRIGSFVADSQSPSSLPLQLSSSQPGTPFSTFRIPSEGSPESQQPESFEDWRKHPENSFANVLITTPDQNLPSARKRKRFSSPSSELIRRQLRNDTEVLSPPHARQNVTDVNLFSEATPEHSEKENRSPVGSHWKPAPSDSIGVMRYRSLHGRDPWSEEEEGEEDDREQTTRTPYSEVGQKCAKQTRKTVVEESDPDYAPDDMEPQGDAEAFHQFEHRDFIYNKRSDYPRGVSDCYTGNRRCRGSLKNKGEFPQIRSLERLRRRLGLLNQTVYQAFQDDAQALFRIRCGRTNATKTSDRKLWDAMLWELASSPYLPPVVRDALTHLPAGRWDQLKRYAWHGFDNIVNLITKSERDRSQEQDEEMAEFLCRNPRWVKWEKNLG